MRKKHSFDKFIVLCHARTGSTLLGSLLGSHPQIFWGGEYYNRIKYQRIMWRILRPLAWHYPLYYLSYQAAAHGKPVYGSKLAPQHTRDLEGTISQLNCHGWLIIYLQRRNFFQEGLSLIVANRMRHYKTYRGDQNTPSTPALKVEPQKLLEKIRKSRELVFQEQNALNNIPHIPVIYEEGLADPSRWDETAGRIFRALSLPSLPVQSQFDKTWARPYSEIVANYEELVEAVRSSEWGALIPTFE